MESFYRCIGGSRQMYLQQLKAKAKREQIEDRIIDLVMDFREDHPKMGSRQLYHTIQNSGHSIEMGITCFEQLMSNRKLTVGTAKRCYTKTSDGLGKESYQNLTNGLVLNGINQLVVGDITYFMVGQVTYYLFVLKDVYSQRLISLLPSTDMKAINIMINLQNLVKQRGKANLKGCIFHTDNGSQYNAKEVKSYLAQLDMKISRAESCEQNGSCEQCHHIIKNMYLRQRAISNFSQLKLECKRIKHLMNNERAVKELGNITVQEFEELMLKVPLEERFYKTLYNFKDT